MNSIGKYLSIFLVLTAPAAIRSASADEMSAPERETFALGLLPRTDLLAQIELSLRADGLKCGPVTITSGDKNSSYVKYAGRVACSGREKDTPTSEQIYYHLTFTGFAELNGAEEIYHTSSNVIDSLTMTRSIAIHPPGPGPTHPPLPKP